MVNLKKKIKQFRRFWGHGTGIYASNYNLVVTLRENYMYYAPKKSGNVRKVFIKAILNRKKC